MRLTILLLLTTLNLLGQNIEGIILDADTKLPLKNVNIFFKKGNTGTTSNVKGAFNLNLKSEINEDDTIHFSMIGYGAKDILYSDLKKINFFVCLSKKVESISEITVTSNKVLKPEIEFHQLSSLNEGLYAFGSLLLNGNIYVIGGNGSYYEDNAKRAFLEASNTEDLSFQNFTNRLKPGSFLERYNNSLQIYNIENDTWSISKLKLLERANHSINYYNNQIYILGSKSLSTNRKFEYLENKIEILDLKNETIKIDDTNPHQALNSQTFIYKNGLIILGGSVKLKNDGNKVFTNKTHLFDFSTGYWYELNDMPRAKEAKGVIIKDRIYLIGGYDNKALTEIESYNLGTGKWETEGELFDGIEGPALTYHGNLIYIYNLDKVLTFNIVTKVLNEYRINLRIQNSALHYYDNKLYILGGYIENEYSTSPSSKLYSIDISEFLNTKIIKSKTL
ncbi:kelch repeat-containing protein [uncultured Draconibacterium sp.]|uniref:carboxypeptidase-like regulatory domain-containing protein n=1 Tax=uncultured Draconibacterium sp. TaxID=1573823 RepID=UPI003216A505